MALTYILDLLGTAVFGVSGALVARGRQIDIFGVVVFSLITAVGGGTLRDILLGRLPVFWVSDPNYIFVAVAAGLFTFLIVRLTRIPSRPLLAADAFGLALFTITGTQIGLESADSWLIAILMGVLTGTGGGVIRDLLAGRVPLVLRQEIYATASILGASIYTTCVLTAVDLRVATGLSLACVVLTRLISLRYAQSLPVFTEKDT
jgi:uncharacterized membrane protein YeiH